MYTCVETTSARRKRSKQIIIQSRTGAWARPLHLRCGRQGPIKKFAENTGTSFCSGSALVCFECMGLKRPKMASGRPKMAARGLPETPKTAPEGCKRSLRRAPRGKKQWFP